MVWTCKSQKLILYRNDSEGNDEPVFEKQVDETTLRTTNLSISINAMQCNADNPQSVQDNIDKLTRLGQPKIHTQDFQTGKHHQLAGISQYCHTFLR